VGGAEKTRKKKTLVKIAGVSAEIQTGNWHNVPQVLYLNQLLSRNAEKPNEKIQKLCPVLPSLKLRKLCNLLTHYIYVFHPILTVTTDYVPNTFN